jgi:hypothetical protein
MNLTRSFDNDIHRKKSTLTAKLLKSIPPTREWYYKRMKHAHLGANIPPLLEHIDREARDAALLSPFKLRGAFERFLGPDFSVATVQRRKELLREIVLQLRSGHAQYQGNAPQGRYAFEVEVKLTNQLEKASNDIKALPYLGIFGSHAVVSFTSDMRMWRWPVEPRIPMHTSLEMPIGFSESLMNTCIDLRIDISKTVPDVRLDAWDNLVKRARSLSGRLLGVDV